MYGKTEMQAMAPLPIERLKPAPYIGIDLFGPIKIRGEENKRSVGKTYGIIYTCLLTRAVHLDLSVDYRGVFRPVQKVRLEPIVER